MQPLERILHIPPAFFGKRIGQVNQTIGIARAKVLQQLPIHRHPNQFQHDVVRQLDRIGKLANRLQSARIDQFQKQSKQVRFIQSRCPDVCGLRRRPVQKGVQCLLRDHPERDKIVPKSSTVRGQPL